ncbi:MAG: hypothetical protein ACE5LU_25520, partial [Anaerolineae bacterium]
MLTFYLSVLLALGVGILALVTGNSPVLVIIKAGAALLVFSALGWVLNVILLAAGSSSAAHLRSPQLDYDSGSYDDLFTI